MKDSGSRDLQGVLSALTGCYSMTASSYLSLAYGLTWAKMRGWQRKEDAVSVFRGRAFSPLQRYCILHLFSRNLLGEEMSLAVLISLELQLSCFRSKKLKLSCVSGCCLWLDPTGWSCHLQLRCQETESPLPNLLGLPCQCYLHPCGHTPMINHDGCAFPYLLLFNPVKQWGGCNCLHFCLKEIKHIYLYENIDI